MDWLYIIRPCPFSDENVHTVSAQIIINTVYILKYEDTIL